MSDDGDSLIGSMEPKEALRIGLIAILLAGPFFVEQMIELFDRRDQCARYFCLSTDTVSKDSRMKGGVRIDYMYCEQHEPTKWVPGFLIRALEGISLLAFPGGLFLIAGGGWELLKRRRAAG